jgi:hypothetical protein
MARGAPPFSHLTAPDTIMIRKHGPESPFQDAGSLDALAHAGVLLGGVRAGDDAGPPTYFRGPG